VIIIGPFHGQPAVVRIPFGRGVCGTACDERKTQLVPDVHLHPNHIVCDRYIPGHGHSIHPSMMSLFVGMIVRLPVK
jgi:hypothetical protein